MKIVVTMVDGSTTTLTKSYTYVGKPWYKRWSKGRVITSRLLAARALASDIKKGFPYVANSDTFTIIIPAGMIKHIKYEDD